MKNKYNNIFKIAEKINALHQEMIRQALDIYEPEIEEIIRMNIKDKQRIEQALDQLLEVAFDDNILHLFKKLCRHLYFIDKQAAVFYVNSYREMWDEENETKEVATNEQE